ncbi:hypothetical protein AnigIFM60653_004674 [Aspergillus niger]|nr:hypothetical protein AnigIFM60653_004674 [Aspergillus niger]GLA16337.1 hypothetical protein AnigIFM62618_002909 [Aspergillus niger]
MDSVGIEEFRIDEDVVSSILQLSNDELEGLTTLYGDSPDDADIELFIFTCFLLFKRTDSPRRAELAIRKAQKWAASTPPDHSQWRRRLAMMRSIRSSVNISWPLIYGDKELESDVLHILYSGARYRLTGSIEDLNDTINFIGSLLSRTPPIPRLKGMIDLAHWLAQRFEKDRQTYLDDLKAAIRLVRSVASAEGVDYFQRAKLLVRASEWTSTQYECDHDPSTLDKSIEIHRHALSIATQYDNLCIHLFMGLSAALIQRASKRRQPADLQEATATLTGLLEKPSLDCKNRFGVLNSLGLAMISHFANSGDIQYLGRSIEYFEESLDLASFNNFPSIAPIVNLVQTLQSLTESLEKPFYKDYIDKATGILEVALPNLAWKEFPYGTLLHPATLLNDHFNKTNRLEYLDRACKLTRLASSTAPFGPERAQCLCILAQRLRLYFRHTSSNGYLNEAILTAERAVEMTPTDHQQKSHFMSDLGGLLLERWQTSNSSEDIFNGSKVLKEASRLLPSTDPNWPTIMENTATANNFLFKRTGNIKYLNCAIDTLEKILSNHTTGQSDIYLYTCFNLANLLCIRAHNKCRADEEVDLSSWPWTMDLREGERPLSNASTTDVDRALHLVNTALLSIDTTHPEWGSSHKLLGHIYLHRYNIIRRAPDLGREAFSELNSAINVQEIAVRYLPSTHSLRLDLLAEHSATLLIRHEITHDSSDFQKAIRCCREAVKAREGSPRIRIEMAQVLGALLLKSTSHEEAFQVLEEAVGLILMACPRSSSSYDKQSFLSSCFAIASQSAATALHTGKSASYALKVLEKSRGVVAGSFLDARTDLSELRRKHPELARKFEALAEKLNRDPDLSEGFRLSNAENNVLSQDTSKLNRRIYMQQDFNRLVETIRSETGLSNFLLPPSEEEMMDAACQGAIVMINVGTRSDAIVIEKHRISSISLPYLSMEVVDRIAGEFTKSNSYVLHTSSFLPSVLEWLWVVLARPVLDYLGYLHPPEQGQPWPHIWWIPTWRLVYFPIHAAGIHNKNTDETVLDRVVSSYASSVRSLIHSRQGALPETPSSTTKPQQALLISMPETPKQSSLPFAVNEITTINPLIQEIGLTPTHREGGNTNEVLQLMKSSTILHFAGHGMSHASDPTQSCLLTQDWFTNPLTVEKLRQENLQDTSPFLAYLSSCSTGANKNLKLADETIHLVNACQLAGFRHAIGALWEVSDQHCVEVAKGVYETLKEEGLTDEAVARGLHRAIRRVRDSCRDFTMRKHASTGMKAKEEEEDNIDKRLGSLEREFRALGIDAKLGVNGLERDIEPAEDSPGFEIHAASFLWVPYFHHGA